MMCKTSSLVAIFAAVIVPAHAAFVQPPAQEHAATTSLNQEVLRPDLVEFQTPLVGVVMKEWNKSDDKKKMKRLDLTMSPPTKFLAKVGIAITVAMILSSPDLDFAERINSIDMQQQIGHLQENFHAERISHFFSAGTKQAQGLFQSGRESTVQAATVAREVIQSNYGRLQAAMEAQAHKLAAPAAAIPLKMEELKTACETSAVECQTLVTSTASQLQTAWATQVSACETSAAECKTMLSSTASQLQMFWATQIAVQKAWLAQYQSETDARILALPALMAGYQNVLVAHVAERQAELANTLVAWDQSFQAEFASTIAMLDTQFHEVIVAQVQAWSDAASVSFDGLVEDWSLPTTTTQVVADAAPVIQSQLDVNAVDLAAKVDPIEAARVFVATARSVNAQYDELVTKLILTGYL